MCNCSISSRNEASTFFSGLYLQTPLPPLESVGLSCCGDDVRSTHTQHECTMYKRFTNADIGILNRHQLTKQWLFVPYLFSCQVDDGEWAQMEVWLVRCGA